MTKAAAATLAMIFGVTLGCHFAGKTETRDISARRVKASEFVLVDENGQPTARFVTSAGDTRLQFLARDNSTALEIG